MTHDPQTTAETAAWADAFGQCIALARRLKGEMGVTREMAGRYGEEAGRILALAGLTEDETASYIRRIMAMVLPEPQA